jgi:hypothetical protein
MTTGRAALFTGASILALCVACSSGGSNFCGDLPQPGVVAKFDAYSIVSAGDRVTAIEICDTYRCRNYDFNPARQAPGVYNYLWIPFDAHTDVIRNLTVAVLAGSRVIRMAHAPGDLMIPTSGRATDACGNTGVTVRYSPRTRELYGVPL